MRIFVFFFTEYLCNYCIPTYNNYNFYSDDEDNLPRLAVEYGPPNPALDPLLNQIKGRYIVDGQHFLKSIRSLEIHRERCVKSTQGWFKLVKSRSLALFWYLDFECPFCKECRTVTNEPLHTDTEKKIK